jgi:cytochrome c oxidase subunit II
MLVPKRFVALAVVIFAFVAAGAMAWAGDGQPSPWQLGFQQSASPNQDHIDWFHDFLLVLITLITAFVLALLVYVMVRFNAGANPVPSKNTHNTLLEVIWCVVPVLILLIIAIPSFKLLFDQLVIPPADLTVKATGKQWYWTYSYPDNGNFEFDSLMVPDKDLKAGQPRLLAVDNEMVVPVNKVVRVVTTGADVIHAFGVPSFGVVVDAIPGRLNETWFKPVREGVYYGQCRELCGKDHAFMPIAVRVVSENEFAAWAAQAKQKYARDEGTPATSIAAADAKTNSRN